MANIRSRPLLDSRAAWRGGLILGAITASLASGASFLAYPSPFSPLAIIAAAAVMGFAIGCLRQPAWALYAAVFVVLLPIGLIPPNIHSVLNRSLTIATLAIWLFDVLVQHRRIQWTASALFLLGFIAWSLVTLIWAGNLSIGMTVVQTYILRFLLFLFLVPNEITTRHNLKGLMRTLALNGWVLMAASAGTVLLEGYVPGARLKVLGMNENEMGILALVTMIGVLWQAMQPSPRYQRLKTLATWAFLLGTIALVALSGSRGSAISLVVTLLGFCLWKPTRPWGLLGILILALGAASAPFVFSTTLERFATVRGDTLLGGREALWQATTGFILDHPWGGAGIGNAPYAIMSYIRPLRSVLGQETAAVHSPILTIWAETGLVGILLYIGVLGTALWSFMQQYLRHRKSNANSTRPYFSLVSSVFLGYMLSWIKGGGLESDFTYFLMLSLLLIPSCLDSEELEIA